jgi:hypothetical protein
MGAKMLLGGIKMRIDEKIAKYLGLNERVYSYKFGSSEHEKVLKKHGYKLTDKTNSESDEDVATAEFTHKKDPTHKVTLEVDGQQSDGGPFVRWTHYHSGKETGSKDYSDAASLDKHLSKIHKD